MSTDPKAVDNQNQSNDNQSNQQSQTATDPSANSNANDSSNNPIPNLQKRNSFIDKIANFSINAINKAQGKANEAADKINAHVGKTVEKIDKKTNELVHKYEKEVEKLNDKTQQIANKEIPTDMANLLIQANNALDSQLNVIQQQLNKLKQKNIIVDDFQQLSQAKALVFVSQVSVKLIGSAGYGRGIVVAKLADGSWSHPCAIETVEVGAGWQVGVSRTRFVIPLHNDTQIDALLSDSGKQISLSGSMQFAFGNDGRLIKGMISGSDKSIKKSNHTDKVQANATVADMQGFDIGIGAAISLIQPLKGLNQNYYYQVSADNLQMSKILDGTIGAPNVIASDDESKLSEEDRERNKMIDDALVQYTLLVSMLSEGMEQSMLAQATNYSNDNNNNNGNENENENDTVVNIGDVSNVNNNETDEGMDAAKNTDDADVDTNGKDDTSKQ